MSYSSFTLPAGEYRSAESQIISAVVDGTDGSERELDQWGFLQSCRYLLHDGDTKFCGSFREIVKGGGVERLKLPGKESEFECIRGKMGTLDQRRILVETDSIW